MRAPSHDRRRAKSGLLLPKRTQSRLHFNLISISLLFLHILLTAHTGCSFCKTGDAMASQALVAPVPKLLRSSKNSLSPAQSLTVVEVFINAALACICHTRGLIPWDSACFRKRYIDDLQSDFWKTDSNGYSAFCDREPVDSAGESQEFRILKRGEDRRADRVLNMIVGSRSRGYICVDIH